MDDHDLVEGPLPNAAKRKPLTLKEALENHPFPAGRTGWTNPWKVPQRCTFALESSDPRRPPQRVEVVWKPGERLEVPSLWTRAIHRCHAGVVIGGMAPGLVRDGQTEKVDPTLAAQFPGGAPPPRATNNAGRLIRD